MYRKTNNDTSVFVVLHYHVYYVYSESSIVIFQSQHLLHFLATRAVFAASYDLCLIASLPSIPENRWETHLFSSFKILRNFCALVGPDLAFSSSLASASSRRRIDFFG